MKNVLIFGMTYNPGGMESVVMNYYRAINKETVHFDFLANERTIAYEDEIIKSGSKIYKITARSQDPLKYKSELEDFFKNNADKYDSIWVNVCSLANIDYLKMAKKYGIKQRIVHCHNSKSGESRIRKILHILNRHVVSRYATDYWTCSNDSNEWFYGKKVANKNKIVLVNNAINTRTFVFDKKVRDLYRKKLGVEDKFVIGHVGRFHPQKNQTFLLDVFSDLLKNKPNAFLIMVGQGQDEDKIKTKIKALGLQKNVMILKCRDDIPALLCAFDVFVFPSLFEGLPLSLIEAESTNLPTVASSDAIPKLAKINKNFTFVSLNAPCSKWRAAILKYVDAPRSDDNSFVGEHGYDINKEAQKVEELFKGKDEQ